jgi:hypothetical protein
MGPFGIEYFIAQLRFLLPFMVCGGRVVGRALRTRAS